MSAAMANDAPVCVMESAGMRTAAPSSRIGGRLRASMAACVYVQVDLSDTLNVQGVPR